MRAAFCLLMVVFSLASVRGADDGDFYFAVIADPQFGFWDPEHFPKEEASITLAVAELNRLKPKFVVVCGDLINRAGNETETAAYKRIFGKLATDINLYNVAGNHDVGGKELMAYYREHFGSDYYSFRQGLIYGIVINSNMMKERAPSEEDAARQETWLKAELQKAKASGARHIMVFQHHPWYLWYADEDDHYFNMPRKARKEFLPLFKEAVVRHVFSGHYHGTRVTTYDKSIELITTASAAIPMFASESGIRFVLVRNGEIDHRYFDYGSIPHAIDLAQGFAKVH